MTKNVIAIDLGASSGRVVLGQYKNNKITTKIIHRFTTHTIKNNEGLFWDIAKIFDEILIGLNTVKKHTSNGIKSIGIDAWGVDYVLLDDEDNLINSPYHYRDDRTKGTIEKLNSNIGNAVIYKKTGIQSMEINTLNQLLVHDSTQINKAKSILFIANYIAFLLSGNKSIDYSIMSTTSLLNINDLTLDKDMINAINLKPSLFSNFKEEDVVGHLKAEYIDVLGPQFKDTKILQIMSHDTACAVLGTPLDSVKSAYISSGTWSLLGVLLESPIVNKEAYEANFTNELGYHNKVRFMKNINGLFVLQEFFKEVAVASNGETFEQLNQQKIDYKKIRFIDIEYSDFQKVKQMKYKIDQYLSRTHQEKITQLHDYYLTIIFSLACNYKKYIDELENLLGYELDQIHIVGGGSQNELLCQLTANITHKNVTSGPSEATVIGNMLNQLLITKAIQDESSIKQIIQNSEQLRTYIRNENFDDIYQKYLETIGR